MSIALQNSKVIRNLGSLTQFTIADGLVGRTATGITVYDPAIFETDPQFGVEAALSAFDAQFTSSVFWEKTDRPQNVSRQFGDLFSNSAPPRLRSVRGGGYQTDGHGHDVRGTQRDDLRPEQQRQPAVAQRLVHGV